MMPWQLRNSKRRRPRHSEPRPTIELMRQININELRHVIPYYADQVRELRLELRYPDIARLRLSTFELEVLGRDGHIQVFPIKWAKTGFGRPRPILLCNQCGRGVIRLFARYSTYKCRFCHKALYASQKQDIVTRKRLQAAKLRLKLSPLPDINEPLPTKPKWAHRKTYQRIRNEIQSLEAQAKTRRFKKPIDIRLFRYHVS
jgi:hypothetical protein